jgi:hypothetical protein
VRRGFKADAERRSLAERKSLGLADRCRLDPARLAAAKGVPVVPISQLAGVPPEHLARLQSTDPGAFSAAAVVGDHKALIVFNDAHPPPRQANSIAHELAHLLLEHQAVPAFGHFGARTLTKAMEDEADWLAGCLLVPASGIRATMAACGGDLEAAADHYGVSVQLMRWRHNVTQWRPKRKPA